MSISDMIGQKNDRFDSNNYPLPKPLPIVPLEKRKLSLGKISKGKNITFAEQVILKKKWIPGPGYIKLDNWSTLLPKNAGLFSKQDKVTETAQIMKQSAKLPSPHSYNPEVWKKQSSVSKIPGTYKSKDNVPSFAQESINQYGDLPLNKYDAVDLNKIKKKPRYAMINKDLKRFDDSLEKKEKNSPSSNSYNVLPSC